MKRVLVFFLLVISLLPLTVGLTASPPASLPEAPPPPPEGVQNTAATQARQAIRQALFANQNEFLSAARDQLSVVNVQVDASQTWATGWVALTDPSTGQVLPAEPALSLVRHTGEDWTAALPGTNQWREWLLNAPEELISSDTRATWIMMDAQIQAPSISSALSGYHLPWRAGQTVYLSQSVAHDAYITTGNAHYSFDFYISKTMFDIHAAKSGTVFVYRDDVPNDDHSAVNYIVLEDTSTTPTTYQLYLHLAQNSIPENLKRVGVPVAQGQFIGIADNTGQSTGHHLHFQVESTPYYIYWGKSVDITFQEVSINGGRPRVSWDVPYCDWPGDICTEFRTSYISANIPPGDLTAPYGDLYQPQNGATITTPSLNISGWAEDTDSGIASIRLLAKYGGAWHTLDFAANSSPFAYTWDLCADHVPDGPIDIAMDIRDQDGNLAPDLPGLRHLIKDASCTPPPPACAPNADQVALYADPDYQGACLVLGAGSHASLLAQSSLGADNAASLQVGANARVTFYRNSDFTGRSETFISPPDSSYADSNLSDNRIGNDQVSSLVVQTRSSTPQIPRLLWPPDEYSLPGKSSLSLVWEDAAGGEQYLVEFNGVEQGWQNDLVLSLGSLDPGIYLWRVRARNSSGASWWSGYRKVTIDSQTSSAPLMTPVSVPYNDSMETGYNNWANSSNWDQTNLYNHTSGGAVSWRYEPANADGYDTGTPNAGNLTSPPLSIPSAGYYLRFWYRYQTEGPGRHWDQRWLQISTNEGPFVNLLQLTDDPPNQWLQSPVIDLSSYTGKTVRFRFYFVTVDAAENALEGWFIDDFSVTSSPPPVCSNLNEPNNEPESALMLPRDAPVEAEICPGGDVDFYRLSLSPGEVVNLAAEAKVLGSALDTYLFLLDGDGSSVVVENDDLVYAQLTDSALSYQSLRGGDYFVKLRAWNHPSAGGSSYHYRLIRASDTVDPTAALLSPPGSTFLPPTLANIEVSATDDGSGMSHVDFYWHSSDWKNTDWIYLGGDYDGSDGWIYPFDTSGISDQKDIAVYAQAYDRAGNWRGVASWDLAIDKTAPSSALDILPDTLVSTVIGLSWEAEDNLAGLDHFDLQMQTDGGAWLEVLADIPGDRRQAWVTVTAGHDYAFRLRAVDRLGNTEAYPALAEALTRVPASVCPTLDTYENDNLPENANLISAISAVQDHTFCNPVNNGLGDQDWVKLSLSAGERLVISFNPQSSPSAASLRLYAADASTLLKNTQSPDYGKPVSMVYTASQTGSLYLNVAHLDPQAAGTSLVYQLSISRGRPVFFPWMAR